MQRQAGNGEEGSECSSSASPEKHSCPSCLGVMPRLDSSTASGGVEGAGVGGGWGVESEGTGGLLFCPDLCPTNTHSDPQKQALWDVDSKT